MRVALISYPMLFQKNGGLQVQINETLSALLDLGIDVKIFDFLNDRLSDFDIIHVFSANHGNYHIVSEAKNNACKVVISPLAEIYWNKKIARRAKISDRIARTLSNNLNYTFFSKTQSMLKQCDHYIALGQEEKAALINGFDCSPNKISVIRNGIASEFFQAEKSRNSPLKYSDPLNILCIGTVGRRKNQLFLAEALNKHAPEATLTVVGPYNDLERGYKNQLEMMPNVDYKGELPYKSHEILKEFQKADIFILPSVQEVYPLSVLEALASGVPSVTTQNSAMRFDCTDSAFQVIDPLNSADIVTSITNIIECKPEPESCRSLVNDHKWLSVATELIEVYESP